ncbi:MAG: M36 family metallopeptidase [Ardenticatenaceae bacterium]
MKHSNLLFLLIVALLLGGSYSLAGATVDESDNKSSDAPAAERQAGDSGFLTGPNEGEPLDIALEYLNKNKSALGLTSDDVADVVVTDQYTSKHNGVTHIYLRQRYQGIEVFDANLNINIAADGSVINVGHSFVADLAKAVNTRAPSLSATQAVESAADELNLNLTEPLSVLREVGGAANEVLLSDGGISLNDIPVKLMYQSLGSRGNPSRLPSQVRLAWNLSIYELDAQNWWHLRIDAETSKVLDKNNWVIHDEWGESPGVRGDDVASESTTCSGGSGSNEYCVYGMPVESPHHTSPAPPDDGRTMETAPWNEASNASPFGWHDTDGANGAEYTITRGNNAHAYEDGNNPGFSPDGGADLIFNFEIGNVDGDSPDTYEPAAISNLFYWNNIIHDLWYEHGFDEASGNFQENNYGNAGSGSDSVNAEAQDGSGTCNANMATPPDGDNPTMQMYTCGDRDGDLDNGVIAHEYWHGISIRLTGGPGNSSCLDNMEQGGEGWSDWGGLMMTMQPGDTGADSRAIGTWLLGQPPNGSGVRTYPYSTDMNINPHTYDAIKIEAVPHGVGSVWAAMIWEMNWELIYEHGFNSDLYAPWNTGGNNLAMQLVIDGLKLQPCSPGFVDARDAILLADQNLTGGANQCPIWEAFAKRGLGYSADQGSSDSVTDGSEAFDIPPACETLALMPETQNICVGDTASYTVSVGQAFTPPVTMSATGEPAGSSAIFNPNPVTTVPSTTTLTIGDTAGATVGHYPITIIGTDAVTMSQVMGDLNLFDGNPTTVTLSIPSDEATGVRRAPTFEWNAASGAQSYDIEVATDSDFSNIVYSASSESTSHTATSSLSPLTTYYWRVRAMNPCGDGSYSALFGFATEDIPPILVVDDDNNSPDVQPYYTDPLDALGQSYDVWDTNNSDNEPDASYLAPYDMVIWFTGNEFGGSAGPASDGETALGSYLDSGKCLFISGQDYYYDRGLTPFMEDYLGVASASSDVSQTTVTGDGTVFSGLGPYSLTYPINNYSDIITPDGTAELAFSGDQGDAAVNKDSGVYRSTFWGFPFEALPTATEQQTVMQTIVEWCGTGVAVGTLGGSVTDADTGSGISDATITADNGNIQRTTRSDANGNYTITLAVDTYDLIASATSYLSDTVSSVVIMTDTTTTQDFVLQGSSLTYEPDEIEESMEIGDVVTTTVTLSATGPLDVDFSVTISGYEGPTVQLMRQVEGEGEWLYRSEKGNQSRANLGDGSRMAFPKAYRWQPARPSDVNVLLYADDPVHQAPNTYPDQALQALGMAYTAHYDEDWFGFEASLSGGAWDMVLVANDNFTPPESTLTALNDYVSNGGKLVFHSWTVSSNPSHALWMSLGLTWVSDVTEPPDPVYWWEAGHPIFTNPESVPEFTSLDSFIYLVYGQQVEPLAGFEALAGYTTPGPDPNQAALILGNDGRTLFKGFLDGHNNADLDSDTVPDGIELWVNLIAAMQSGFGNSQWASADPDSGIVPAGESMTFDVVFDARSLIEIGDHTAELSFSGNFVNDVPTMPLTMHLSCPTCGILDGEITDLETGDPVNAQLHVTNTNGFDAMLSGDSYEIAVQPGTYNFTVSANGYVDQSATVVATQGTTVTTDFVLTPTIAMLEYTPAEIEEAMQIGDVVSNPVTVTNPGYVDLEFNVRIRGYDGPAITVPRSPVTLPASDGNYPRSEQPVSAKLAPSAPVAPVKHDRVPDQTLREMLGAPAYGIARNFETGTTDLSSFDTDSPENLNVIGTMGSFGEHYPAADFLNGEFEVLYALNEGSQELVAIDTNSSLVSVIGSSVPDNLEFWTGMAGDPTTGEMYASSAECGTSSSLYTIDVTTGAPTLVGPITNAPCIIAIAINGSGELYGLDIDNDTLLSIDKATGEGTEIGSIGFDALFSQGMDFDEESGILYLAVLDPLTFMAELRIADTTTGNSTPVGPLGTQGPIEMGSMAIATGGMSGSAWASAVPDSGIVPAGSSMTFDVVFDSRELTEPGEHTAELSFSGNFVNDPGIMPLSMTLEEGDPPVISDVRTTNVRDVAFAVSWVTDVASSGEVHYGTDPSNLDLVAEDVRGTTRDDTHYVLLQYLSPETTYYFDVVSGSTTDDNGGTHYSVTTGPTLSLPGTDTVYGQVLKADGSTPADGSIVYITLNNNDDSGSTGQSASLSALVENGSWTTNLGNARTEDVSAYFGYSASGDQLLLEAQGAADGMSAQIVDTADDKPAASMTLNMVPIANVDLSPDMVDSGDPGSTVNYSLQVTNTGDVADTFAVTVAAGNSWATTVSPASVTLNAGASMTIMAAVMIPADATADETDMATIMATSALSPTVSDEANLTTTAVGILEPNVDLSLDMADSGDPGSTVNYSLQLTNTGNVTDTFALTVAAGNSWATTMSPASVTLNAGASTTIMAAVMIPADATADETDMATIIATSALSPTVNDSANLTTTTNQVAGLELSPDMAMSETVGRTVTYTLQVTNTGNVADTFDLAVSGNDWNTTLSNASVSLNAGASTMVTVHVEIPSDTADGESETATATAISQADSTVSEQAQLTTTGLTNDGVPDEVEDGAPNNGDGNNDGTPDSQQEHVTSLPSGENNQGYVTLESPAGTLLVNVEARPASSMATMPTDTVHLEMGVFDFMINDVEVGGSVVLTLTLHHTDTLANSYWKYGPEPGNSSDHWYEFNFDGTTGAEINGNTITLHFVDGQRGDHDLSPNGQIIDPGAPAMRQAPLNVSLATFDEQTTIPSRQVGLALLLTLMAGVGLFVLRKRQKGTESST